MIVRAGSDRARTVVPKSIWWIVTAFPALFLLIGLGTLVEAIVYTTDAQSTRGEVVKISRIYGSEGSVSYKPTIRYQRDDGRIFEAETHISSSGYDYDIGQRVDILYSYGDPTEVRINSLFSLYGPGLIFAVVGVLFLSIFVPWVRRKVGRRAVSEQEAGSLVQRTPDAAGKQEPEPKTTDPSKPGHVHKPKPERVPAVRRMR